MEDFCNNHDEDTLLASKTWNKIIDSASKVKESTAIITIFQIGYREGIEDGSASVFQKGFDRGYEDGFKTTFILGVYKGIAKQITKDLKHPEEIENILLDTKKGICYLCKCESCKDKTSKPIIEVENCQREHSSEILKMLEDYFNPILKKHSIDPSTLNVHD